MELELEQGPEPEPFCLINGRVSDSLTVSDRGLAYGDGLFETMRMIDGRIPLLEKHIKRAQTGCLRLGITLDSRALRAELDLLISRLSEPQAVVKLIVARAGRAQGYGVTTKNSNRILSARHLNDGVTDRNLNPWNLQVCQLRLASQPALAGIKHLNRLEQVLAAAELKPGIDEGLMLDQDDYVIEGISGNLLCVFGDDVCTPDLIDSGVAGVMRQTVGQLLERHGVNLKIERMRMPEVLLADEIMLCNAVRGIRNIGSIDGHELSNCRMVGDQIRALLRSEIDQNFYSF